MAIVPFKRRDERWLTTTTSPIVNFKVPTEFYGAWQLLNVFNRNGMEDEKTRIRGIRERWFTHGNVFEFSDPMYLGYKHELLSKIPMFPPAKQQNAAYMPPPPSSIPKPPPPRMARKDPPVWGMPINMLSFTHTMRRIYSNGEVNESIITFTSKP